MQPYPAHPPTQPNPYAANPYAANPYAGYAAAVPSGVGLPRPVAVAEVPGTPYAVALVELRPTLSGPAVASLFAGIASILVSLVVTIFTAVGAGQGWGAAVAGAFAILSTAFALGAVGLHRAALTGIRTSVSWGPTRGRGVATAGLICGLVGLGVSLLAMVIALATS